MIYSLNADLGQGKLDVMKYSARERTPTTNAAMAHYLRLRSSVECLAKIAAYSDYFKASQKDLLHNLDTDEMLRLMLSALLSRLSEDMNLTQTEETLLQNKELIDKLQRYWHSIVAPK